LAQLWDFHASTLAFPQINYEEFVRMMTAK
jgi:hypothetical protein